MGHFLHFLSTGVPQCGQGFFLLGLRLREGRREKGLKGERKKKKGEVQGSNLCLIDPWCKVGEIYTGNMEMELS